MKAINSMVFVVLAMVLAVICAVAQAAPGGPVIGVVVADSGASIEFAGEPGPCVGGALAANWFSPDRRLRIGGCWKLDGERGVQVAFFDGDVARVPMSAISKPASM